MAGQSSGGNSPPSAVRRTQWPPLFSPLSSSLWLQVMRGCKVLKGGRNRLGSVILWAMPAPSPAQPMRGAEAAPPSHGFGTAAERRAASSRLTRTYCQITAQRFYISVYLCYSEMVPCHWDRKQLWTEISAYDGNVSSVMLFHIFLKAWLSANWHIYMLAL